MQGLLYGAKRVILRRLLGPVPVIPVNRRVFSPPYRVIKYNKTGDEVNVKVVGMDICDLKASRLPDTKFGISVDIVTADDKVYHLYYQTNDKEEEDSREHWPRMHLETRCAMRDEFDAMHAYMTDMNGGRPIAKRPVGEWNESGVLRIDALIHDEEFPFTQKSIADMVANYREQFRSATIMDSYFFKVPRALVENPGFSKSKLKIQRS